MNSNSLAAGGEFQGPRQEASLQSIIHHIHNTPIAVVKIRHSINRLGMVLSQIRCFDSHTEVIHAR